MIRSEDTLGWARAYRTPLALFAFFLVMLAVFAVTPDPTSADADRAQPTSEPTPGPRECVVCPIDQECDAKSGRCVFVKHTPLPCVPTANFDERAGFCLPEGAVAPPPSSGGGGGAVSEPDDGPDIRRPVGRDPSEIRRGRTPRRPRTARREF